MRSKSSMPIGPFRRLTGTALSIAGGAGRSVTCLKYVRIMFACLCLVPFLAASSCIPPQIVQIAEDIRDDDEDGWFTNPFNRATTLTLAEARFMRPGDYRFIVDDTRFPKHPQLDGRFVVGPSHIGQSMAVGIPVATRIAGSWVVNFPNGIPYTSRVRVVKLGGVPEDPREVTVGCTSNGNETIPVDVGDVHLTFRTSVELFADPNPNDPNGDSDGDGIKEWEEAGLAQASVGLGDPRPGRKDIYLIVGYMHDYHRLDPKTRELLRSRFAFRDINLIIDDGNLNGQSGLGGFMRLDGQAVAVDSMQTIDDTERIRSQNLPQDHRRRVGYFAVLANSFAPLEMADCPPALPCPTPPPPRGCAPPPPCLTGFPFGMAEEVVANRLIIRSRLGVLPPNGPGDTLYYQAGVLMHELGHLLGLGERPGDDSIMGSPAETEPITLVPPLGIPGNPLEMPDYLGMLVGTLRRPLDYTQAEWDQLQIGRGLPSTP